MKYFLYLSAFLILLAGCSSSKNASGGKDVNPSNNDGSSEKTAIVINETNEMTGVDTEYAWLKKNYPGYSSEGQALVMDKAGHPFDIIHIKTADGQKKDVYFDISKFFGKM
ncbi:MAG TPA: hypothetical protein VNZ45_12465 [Bacteroidia bacterium]|jgi:hypothetical protein|nr:hypothetical protein [Bacteroidia bacterium]